MVAAANTRRLTENLSAMRERAGFRVMRSKLKLGIANGWMKADGEIIYRASDLRVGLFTDADATAGA